MRCKFYDSFIEDFIIMIIIVTEVNTSNENAWMARKTQNINPSYYMKNYNNFQQHYSTTEKSRQRTAMVSVDTFASHLPKFQKVPAVIEVTPGQTAILSCIVTNLGDRMVSWIRSHDLQILTSGAIPFTADQRFLSENPHDGNNNWGLQIQNTRQTDSGNYECQINTEPKMKNNVTLIVREPQLMDIPYMGTVIDGPREQVVKSGTTVTFTCTATYSNSNSLNSNGNQTREIVWIKDNEVISYTASRGGINIYTEWGITAVKSTLTMASVTTTDSGEYVCRTANLSEDIINLVVVHGINRDKARGLTALRSSTRQHRANQIYYSLIVFVILINVFIIK